MATHTIHALPKAGEEEEEVRVGNRENEVTELHHEHTTDDAEDAAWIAERAQINGYEVAVVTSYDDEEEPVVPAAKRGAEREKEKSASTQS